MPERLSKFSRRSNDNLLQLWRGRGALDEHEIGPLRDEIEHRGLSAKIQSMDDDPPSRNIYGELPEGPRTYLNSSVLVWWLRELWLRFHTRNGIIVDARIESTQRTNDRFRTPARAELIYSYEFQGREYIGKVVRDFFYDRARADSLVYDHHPYEKIFIRLDRDDPSISYFPSGLGSFDPIALGLPGLALFAFLIALLLKLVLA